ncbi:hypothetical protein SSX86_031793 [Deinandra increscens subsp. villosa]|uniref:Heat shock protein 70 n=1 Tax=Deinandra increscens subsp. villosa TaxID=3103831 RepID=A0AAP0C4I5_9ASTR
MSVIGFDIGNESCVIAAARRGGVDVLLNDESKNETPAVVSFGEKQRFFGSAGAAFATANPKSTLSHIKRLIGKLYKEVEEDLKLLPFATSEGPRGGILIKLEYLKTIWTFTPVEILGMLLKHLKQITEKNLDSAVVDCVIGIPSYFTDLQRRMYLDAAIIAGLKPLRLMHDGTAIALVYGMYMTDISNSRPTNAMFVDVGHCDTQVTVAAFEPWKMKILSHSFDQNLGGKDFDEVLFHHLAAEIKKAYKIDVYANVRASIRLRASCEKVKKVLSADTHAPLTIDCLMGDTDVRGFVTRKEFENLSSKLLERIIVPCNMALKDAGLSVDKIDTIELVGSASHIPAITRILRKFFKKEPARTLNARECVARGCALRCAMLSPSLIVRDYKVFTAPLIVAYEYLGFPIVLRLICIIFSAVVQSDHFPAYTEEGWFKSQCTIGTYSLTAYWRDGFWTCPAHWRIAECKHMYHITTTITDSTGSANAIFYNDAGQTIVGSPCSELITAETIRDPRHLPAPIIQTKGKTFRLHLKVQLYTRLGVTGFNVNRAEHIGDTSDPPATQTPSGRGFRSTDTTLPPQTPTPARQPHRHAPTTGVKRSLPTETGSSSYDTHHMFR